VELITALSWQSANLLVEAPPTGLEPVTLQFKIKGCRTSGLPADPRDDLSECGSDVGGSSRLGLVLRGS
jgi:hypothetical protein